MVSLCDTTRREVKGSHKQIDPVFDGSSPLRLSPFPSDTARPRGSTTALRVAPFQEDIFGSPPEVKYKTLSKVGHVTVDFSCTLVTRNTSPRRYSTTNHLNPSSFILLPLTTPTISNMPSRSIKPPRCQHKPSASCALCRREKNDLQQVGAWARDPSTAMAGVRTEPTDYASFVQDSSYFTSTSTSLSIAP